MNVSKILKKRRFTRRRKDGTVRIVRDGYHNAKSSWFETRRKVLERDDHRCRAILVSSDGTKYRCPNTTNLEVHHIVPLSKGGTNSGANLITLCSKCHDKRHLHLKRKR